MRALLLCAGRGRRFDGALGDLPKVLLEVVPGVTLLSRHLRTFEQVGLDGVTVVVGYEADQVRAALESSLPIEVVVNPRFSEGSMISLASAEGTLCAGTSIVMDADVLYDEAFMDDEMKIALVDGRVHHLSKRLEAADYEAVGRGPGF
ncbi:MAG TPA: NTP transferase domain-containing protein [Myxococcota bacterium]|nr:NTP transferase domain-containing protein [Myxococcota bacterium]